MRPIRVAMIAAIAITPFLLQGQTAVVSGTLTSFDVVNDTGQPAHGFEIQLEGALPTDLYYTYNYSRYGVPAVVPYATGVYVRYQSAYDTNTGLYAQTTPQNNSAGFSWQNCYQGGAGYATSGCEHLAQSMRYVPPSQPITVTGRWLIEEANNPGHLVAAASAAAIPWATWAIAPFTTAGIAPVVVAVVTIPKPAKVIAQFGDAHWVKIFKTHITRPVTGDELVSGNAAVVPEDATQVEVAWDILQVAPPNLNGKKNRTRRQNQGGIATNTASVVRRYETYKYTGAYDPLTHEVACLDLTCTAPSTGELGGPLSANNTAVNVVADSLTVTKSGSAASTGNVVDATAKISCGGACAMFTTSGANVTLTASPNGSIFGGWSGSCSGTQLTCSLSVTGKTDVGVSFLKQFSLSIGRSNSGTVTSDISGNDRAISCGGACSAKFTDGTVVTLTATPPAGKTFVNWSGACVGTSPTCAVTISKDTSVQAVFGK